MFEFMDAMRCVVCTPALVCLRPFHDRASVRLARATSRARARGDETVRSTRLCYVRAVLAGVGGIAVRANTRTRACW